MKISQTKYGQLAIDENEDRKVLVCIEKGEYPSDKEIETVLEFVTSDSVVADVGANIGTFAIPIAKKVKAVHCFEPIPRNLELLRKNIELNGLTNVIIHPYALGDKNGHTSFELETEKNSGTYRASEGREFEIRTLDEVGIPFDFIKIDVQGLDVKVVEGGIGIIKNYHPILFFELSGRTFEYGSSLKDITDMLGSYNLYVSRATMPNDTFGAIWSLPLVFAVFLPRVFFLMLRGYHFDVLAIPKKKDVRIKFTNPFLTLMLLFLKRFLRRDKRNILSR